MSEMSSNATGPTKGQKIRISTEGVVTDVTPDGAVLSTADGNTWFIGVPDYSRVEVLEEVGPEQPTGLGAVVEGEIGGKRSKWVRLGNGRWQDPFDEYRWTKWEFLANVEVISQGAE